MATETYIHPAGTKFFYSSNGGGAFTEITDVVSLEMPEMKVNKSDNTVLSNTNRVKTSGPGWKEPGEGKLTLMLVDSQHTTLLGYMNSETILRFKEQLPAIGTDTIGAVTQFDAWISSHKQGTTGVDGDEKVTMEYALQQTGDDSFAEGSA